jgi:hypothetical protein
MESFLYGGAKQGIGQGGREPAAPHLEWIATFRGRDGGIYRMYAILCVYVLPSYEKCKKYMPEIALGAPSHRS